ncbi:MAG: hypothetical protein ACI8RZ_002071 [Myxococcota bacterium]|jgi:hypothetical protein
MRRCFSGFTPTGRDIFVATHMKSGTNWMMQMAAQIAHRGAADFEHIHDLVPWPDTPDSSCVGLDDPRSWEGAPTGLRVIKTHANVGEVPRSEAARYIVVLRDPKEVLVSSYFFAPPILGVAEDITPQEWLRLVQSSRDSSWLAHTLGWWALRDEPNVLVLHFAEMKADLPGTVDQVAAFMGVSLEAEERATVIERSGLAWMKANNEKFSPVVFPFSGTRPDMIRSGKSGNAGELYSAAELASIDESYLEALDHMGSDFPYRALFTAETP